MSFDSSIEPPENKMTDFDHAIGQTFEAIEALSAHIKFLKDRGKYVELERVMPAYRALNYAKQTMEMEKFPI